MYSNFTYLFYFALPNSDAKLQKKLKYGKASMFQKVQPSPHTSDNHRVPSKYS